MKKQYETLLKDYLKGQFLKTRGELKMTQEQMAEGLAIETRSYCNDETGVNLCNTVSFTLYLIYYCSDSQKLLDEIKDMFDGIRKNNT